MKVTLLNGLYKIQKGHYDLSDIIMQIKTGVYTPKVIECRNTLNFKGKRAYQKIKVELPCFTPSGKFGQAWTTTKGERRPIPPTKRHLLEYNGIVVLDYDDLEQEQLIFLASDLQTIPYTHASFFSPSDRGYKVFVRTTNKDPQKHSEVFQAVRKHYQELTGIEDDKSSSNFNRLCFVSVDSQLHYDEESKVFEFQPKLFDETPKEVVQPVVVPNGAELDDITKAINRIESNGYTFVDGQRHEFRKQFSIECVKFGIPKDECISFVENSLITVDTNIKKALDVVEWAYTNVKEVGIYSTWKKDSKKSVQPKPKAKEYTPELYKEKVEEKTIISIPELSYEEIVELDKKTKDAILSQKSVESTLNKYFDFRINTLKDREEYKMKAEKKFKALDKVEYNQIVRSLMYHGIKCTPNRLESIILSHFSKQVHPLKEMFEGWGNGLKEDETDYIAQVAKFVKTDAPKNLFLTVFKKWLVASVANIFVEGHCTNHHCIILCGGQGTNKTTFFTSLFSEEYIFTGHIDLKNKDSMIMLSDTFLVVLDEQFSVIDKEKDWESLKSAVTMPRIKARWVYAKHSKLRPRIANFCGTANRIEILQDDTGNRRFIPFQLTEPININGLQKIDVRKMWGQAYNLYKENWFYLPTSKEKSQIDRYQQGFKKLSNEHYLIMDMFEPLDDNDAELWSSKEIWNQLDKDYNIGREVSIAKVGRAMNFLSFVQKTVVRPSDSKRGRYWLVKRL
jgi:hypothetical protein